MSSPQARRFEGFGRVLLNGMSGAGSRIAMMLVGFLLTPFVIWQLGMLDFGLMAIFGSIAGYLGLLDFGLGGTFVKFITEYTEREDLASARQVITFGMLFYAGFGILMAVPVFVFAPSIVHLFNMPAASAPYAATVFREFFAVVVVSMVFSIPGTAVVAKHRMDLVSRNNFAGYLASAILTVVFLRLHFGLTGIVLAQVGQLIVTATLHYVTARRMLGPLFADPRRLDGQIVRRMFHFGGWTQVSALLNVVINDTGRFVSASMVSVASVTYYEVGGKLAYISRTLPNYLVDAVLPAAAAADARDDRVSLRQLELTSSLYLLFATTLIAGFVAGASGPIAHVWLGTDYPFVQAITLWLAAGYVLSSGATVGVTMLRSIGRPELEAACIGVGAAVNIIATLLLTRMFGIVGAAAGSTAGWVAFAVFYALFERQRRPSESATQGLFSAVRIIGVGACCAGLLAWFVRMPWMRELFASRVPGLAGIALCGVLYVAIFIAASWATGSLRFDQERIERNAVRLRRFSAAQLGRVRALC